MNIFDSYFGLIKDSRQQGKVLHNILDILFIVVSAAISGCDDWESVFVFSKHREAWLRQYLELPNGIPSLHTLRRVVGMINPVQFQKCFCRWTKELVRNSKGTVVAIDGKTARGAYKDDERKSPIHLVSAWSENNGLVLGQVKTHEKSNEITAIPELLDLLMIKGCVVTIDAMGTQKTIATKIIKENKADYVLALKGNHSNLHEAVKGYFEDALMCKFDGVEYEKCITKGKGHGRYETREYYLIKNLKWLPERKDWTGIQSVGMVVSKIEKKGQKTSDTRFFICSVTNVETFAHAVRTHWGIESMHWCLDVTFREDANRTRTDYEPENLALLRKMTRNMLMLDKKNDDPKKPRSTNVKRYMATLDEDILDRVMVRNAMEFEEY